MRISSIISSQKLNKFKYFNVLKLPISLKRKTEKNNAPNYIGLLSMRYIILSVTVLTSNIHTSIEDNVKSLNLPDVPAGSDISNQ